MDTIIDDGDLLCALNDITYQYNALQGKYDNLIERIELHNTRMNELVNPRK